MGLDHVHVLSSERHYSEFQCACCKRLTSLDSYVTSNCSHPICKSCCSSEVPPNCPACQEPVGELKSLSETQPLAHRVLGRVKVACPLRKRCTGGCTWAGDYRHLQHHVDSHRRAERRGRTANKAGKDPSPRKVAPADAASVQMGQELGKTVDDKMKRSSFRDDDEVSRSSAPAGAGTLTIVSSESNMYENYNLSGADPHPARSASPSVRSASPSMTQSASPTMNRTASPSMVGSPSVRSTSPGGRRLSVSAERRPSADNERRPNAAQERPPSSGYEWHPSGSNEPRTTGGNDRLPSGNDWPPSNDVIDGKAVHKSGSNTSLEMVPTKQNTPNYSLPPDRYETLQSPPQEAAPLSPTPNGLSKRRWTMNLSPENSQSPKPVPQRRRSADMLSSTGSLTSGSTISSNEQVDLPSGFNVVTEQDGRPPLQKAKSEMVPFSASALSSKQARPRRPSVTTTNGTNDATLAKSFKDKAIKAFRGGHYQEAAEFYTAALEVLPQVDKEKGLVSSLYSNRAATYLRLNEFSECINDADEALRLDYNNVKSYLRKAWAQMELGMLDEACTTLAIGMGRIPRSPELEREMKFAKQLSQTVKEVRRLHNQGLFTKVIETTDNLDVHKNNKHVLLARANAYLSLNEIDKAMDEANAAFTGDEKCLEALEVRAKARYLSGRLEDARMDCHTALGIEPSRRGVEEILQKVKRVEQFYDEAEKSIMNCSFKQACNLYSMAIHAAEPLPKPTELYRMLYMARARANLEAGNYMQALANTNLVLESDPQYINAWESKVKALEQSGRHQQIADELRDIVDPDSWGSGYRTLVDAFERAMRKLDDADSADEEQPDYYKVLGVERDASMDDIKRVYKEKAKEYHPDRFVAGSFTEEEKLEASEKFKLLQQSMDVLGDDEKRRQFDKDLRYS